ncbi:MAG: hypothetical protein H0X68_07315 [Chloroflexi bacterium]|nr:hypothetical protein [Chloroflexota bacterium]
MSLLGAVLAALAVYALQFLRFSMNTRVRTVEDLERATGLPVLASFPRIGAGSRRLPLETASYLRTAIAIATANVQPKILLVTSANAADGKSSVAIALATSFARQRSRTLLLDLDLRRPVLGSEFGLSRYGTPRTSDALEGQHDVFPTAVSASSVQFDVLPSFSAAPDASE